MKKGILIIFILIFPVVNAITYNDIDFIKDNTNDGFYQNNKYIKFPKDSVFINNFDGNNVKFDIDFTKGGWKGDHWEYKVKIYGIEKLDEWHYIIGNKMIYFQPVYELLNNESIIVDDELYINETWSDYSLVNIEIRKNELVFTSSIDYYDPMISTWNNNSRTAMYNFEENDNSQEVLDEAGNPNNHNGTLVDASGYSYITGPSGSGYAGDFDATSYFDADNPADFGSVSDFEICAAVRHPDPSNGAKFPLISQDNTDIRIQLDDGDWDFTTVTSGTSCAIDDNDYVGTLSANTWYYFCFQYNGSSCTIYNNLTNEYSEASSGNTGASSYFRIAQDNSEEWQGEIDCVSIYMGSYLSDDARQDAYNDCFGISEGGGGGQTQAQTPTIINTSQNNESIYITIIPSSMDNYSLYNFSIFELNTTDNTYNWTGLGNNTEYCFNVTSYDSSKDIPISNYSNTICTYTYQNNGVECTESLINTSWTPFVINSTCRVDDTYQYVRNRTTYDENNCGFVNITFWDTNETDYTCNYCSYSVYYTSYTTCDGSYKNRTYFDENWYVCGNITGIASDLYLNDTAATNYTYWDIVACSNATATSTVCAESDYDCRLDLIEEENEMIYYVIMMISFLVYGYWAATNYNYGFGVPFIFMGALMMFKFAFQYFNSGEWWLAALFTGLMVVTSWSVFFLRSKKNRVLG